VEQLTFGAVPTAERPRTAWTGYGIERELAAVGSTRAAGADEAGRGAWAGPVVVCAVVAKAGFPAPPDGLTDSRRLTPQRRADLAAKLPGRVGCYAIGEASHEEIDMPGMTVALRRAAVSALQQLPDPDPHAVLLDGSHDCIGRPWPVRCAKSEQQHGAQHPRPAATASKALRMEAPSGYASGEQAADCAVPA
jgi:ribonuclease HII